MLCDLGKLLNLLEPVSLSRNKENNIDQEIIAYVCKIPSAMSD